MAMRSLFSSVFLLRAMLAFTVVAVDTDGDAGPDGSAPGIFRFNFSPMV